MPTRRGSCARLAIGENCTRQRRGKRSWHSCRDPLRTCCSRALTLTKFTRNTITTLAALKVELARVRRRGFSVNDEEVELGVRCIGAPIFDSKARVIATLSIAGPVFRMTKDRVPELARTVVSVANALSTELGHHEAAL